MRRAGWQAWVVPQATAVHGGAVSARRAGRMVDEHRIGSLDRYYAREHRGLALLAFRLVRWAGYVGRALGFGLGATLSGRRAWREKALSYRRDAVVARRLFRSAP